MKVSTVQQDQEFEWEDDEKITTARFTGVGPIDLGLDSGNDMNIGTLGIV